MLKLSGCQALAFPLAAAAQAPNAWHCMLHRPKPPAAAAATAAATWQHTAARCAQHSAELSSAGLLELAAVCNDHLLAGGAAATAYCLHLVYNIHSLQHCRW